MAHETDGKSTHQMVGLPLQVIGPVDVGRLIRELESIDNVLMEQELRKQAAELPRTSHMMERTIEFNKLDLQSKEQRSQLMELLKTVKDRAPLLHISFSSDPTADFIEKLMAWLRQQIHPVLLLTIGLQPNIGAGCIVRSTNKYFDCSLRQDFLNKRDLLMKELVVEEKPSE